MTSDAKFSPDLVPEPVRGEAYWKSFEGKTVGDVLTSAVNAQKLIGNSVRIPGADAKPEDWTAYYDKLRPGKPEDYKLPFSAEFDKRLDPKVKGEFTKAFHEIGLMPQQAAHVAKVYENLVQTQANEERRQLELATETVKSGLKTKYGPNWDKANTMVNRAVLRFGGEKFAQAVKDYQLEADPVFFDTFYEIAKMVHEDSWISGDPPKFKDINDSKKELQDILNDKKHPYHNVTDHNYNGAVEHVANLRKAIWNATHPRG